MAGLDLSSFAGMMAGSSRGPVIAPNLPERSLMWKLIENDTMPQGGKLSPADKQLLRTYIEQGRFPAEVDAKKLEARDLAKIKPKDREWWSFKHPVKAAPPAVKHKDQVRTPIDSFVLAKLEEKNWRLEPIADRVTLIRRAYLDLIGLLPTQKQVEAFIADKSPNAYEKVIDELLASPHYGEAWGRHWLDIAGYSDSVGDAGDRDRVTSWKYRDYVINAFNKNKPYDRFIQEQLAGDQLINCRPLAPPANDTEREALTATGFLRMTADITDNQTIYEVDKYFDAQQKAMETSLKSIMGLTINCARCHDHKFDPILQRDYYKLMAVYQATFDPENWLAGSIGFGPWPSRNVIDVAATDRDQWIKDVTSNNARAVRRDQLVLTALYQRFREEVKAGKDMSEPVRREIVSEVKNNPDLDVDPNAPKDYISDSDLEQRFPELLTMRQELQVKRRASQSKVNPNYIMAVWDVSRTPSPTYILQRGNYLAPGAEVQPGLPLVLDNPDHAFKFPDPKQHPEWNHTGRRLALAQWLTSADNPLTARVFVNRVWQFHFGEGIVSSVDDFGAQGSKPTHPELLDWLAVSFVEHNWDVKWLNKQIMMSAVYQQRSDELAEQAAADPSDKLLWRKAPLRLEAEVIRDSMLEVSGLLNDKMFGPQEALKQASDNQWIEDNKKSNPNRRSVYLAQRRTRPEGFLHVFDGPDMTSDNQTKRFRSALPTQSLALLNNPLIMRTSKAFADQVLEQSHGDVGEALNRAYQAAFLRSPSSDEIAFANKLIASYPEPKQGLRLFVQGMMGANEFLYSF
jgi:hypothetical protein